MPNETTRLERAKAYLESKGLRWGRTPDDPQNVPTGELDRRPNRRLEWCVEFDNAECTALEKENADLKQAIYVGKEIVAARDREIESLTDQLDAAREAMEQAS